MNITKTRKFKYGALAVTLTCVCVALIICFNFIFSALASRFGWFVDMTKEQLFEPSPSTLELLDGYRDMEGFSIKIIFCQEPDILDASFYTHMVHNLVQQYEDEFNFITVEYVNIDLHPGAVEEYRKVANAPIAKTSVIITNGSSHRVYTLNAFFVFDENDTSTPLAFDGEYKLTSAILSLTGDNPTAYFTTGHSEDVEGSAMFALFEEAGFTVKTIDLSKQDAQIDEDAMIVVINNPKYDFMGANQTVNEINKLDKFLDGMGNLMVFLDTDAKADRFTELNEFLSEWGLRFDSAHVYDYSNSLSHDGTEIVATYETEESLGANLTSALRESTAPPKIVINNARPISLLYDINITGSRKTAPVLTTSPDGTAVSVPFTAASNEEGTAGIYNLMAICAELRYINNVECYNYVLCAGTSSFADADYVGSSIYGNRDLILSAMKTFGKANVPIDLDFKLFDEEGLDLTAQQANQWTVVLSAIIPGIVFAAGIVVFVRRRHL